VATLQQAEDTIAAMMTWRPALNKHRPPFEAVNQPSRFELAPNWKDILPKIPMHLLAAACRWVPIAPAGTAAH